MLSLLITASISAQDARHRTGGISGQVVSVTKSGEIKPALFAQVYLLNCTDKTEPSGEDICSVHLREEIEVVQNDSKLLESDPQHAEYDTDKHDVRTERSSLAYAVRRN